jgi:hypothetical protein
MFGKWLPPILPVVSSARFGINMSEEVPVTTQGRAYRSPIWYKPPGWAVDGRSLLPLVAEPLIPPTA